MSSKRSRHQRSPLAAAVRVLVLVPTWIVFVPVARLMEWLGWMPGLLRTGSMLFSTNWLGRWEGYRPTASDVIVGSYLKSGTTWTLQIAVQIAFKGRVEFEHLHDLVPWPDTVKKGYAIDLDDDGPARASATGLRVIKTHAPWEGIPYAPEAKYILVVRDPKDVFVSSYYFLRGALFGPLMPSVQSWFAYFLSPRFTQGPWPEHAHSYWRARHLENVLFLTYKGLKADLRGSISRIAKFLDVALSPEELDRVCEHSSFESMKRRDEAFAPGMLTPWSAGVAMVRRGEQGGSAELLSRAQQEQIDSSFQAALARIGSDLDWNAVCSPPAVAGPTPRDTHSRDTH